MPNDLTVTQLELLRQIVLFVEETGDPCPFDHPRAADAAHLVARGLCRRDGHRAALPVWHTALHDLYRADGYPYWERRSNVSRILAVGSTQVIVFTDADPRGRRWEWRVYDGVASHWDGKHGTLDVVKRRAVVCAQKILEGHATRLKVWLEKSS